MKIKTTKTMRNFIAKALKGLDCVSSVAFDRVSFRGASMYGLNSHDYDIETGMYNVITVYYKDDCYALPRYISTDDLRRLVAEYNITTLEKLAEHLRVEYEI